MPRKSSIHFKPVSNVRFAVSHAERTDLSEPAYLLPQELRLANVVIAGSLSENEISALFEKERAGMTGQAKARKSSPFWEGVVVLDGVDAKQHSSNLNKWKRAYEKATGHKVLHMSVHLDEGYLDDKGKPQYNAHAHVIVNRMDGKNRIINLGRKQLADVQDLTAKVLQMQRGSTLEDRKGMRGRQHIPHREYRAQAEEGRLEVKQAVNKAKGENFQRNEVHIAEVKAKAKGQHEAEIAELKAKYKAEREAMKASGQATQQAYQALKVAHEAALAELVATRQELKDTNKKVIQMDKYTKKLEADLVESNSKIAQALVDKALAIEALIASGKKSEALRVTATGHRVAAEKLVAAAQRPLNPAIPLPQMGEVPPPKPTKTAPEPVLAPSLGKPLPEPEKTLKTRLSESWTAFVDWIKAKGGKVVQVQDGQDYFGPVVQRDDLHAVQSTGQGKHVIHELEKLDQVPELDNPKLEIRYRNGLGHVSGGHGRVPKMR